MPNTQQPELRRAYKRILDYQLIYSGWNIWSEKMSDMSISGSLDSSGGVQSHHSETSGNSSAGKFSTDLKSVTNSTEQTSEGLSRASSVSRLPEGQPNIQPSERIRVPQGPVDRSQINQTGGSGNSGVSTSLKINEPAAPTCQTSEISGSGSPVILGNTSPEWLKKNVIDYVDSLKFEFGPAVPERVIDIQKFAKGIVSLAEYRINNNLHVLGLDLLNEGMLTESLSIARNKYAVKIKALSADWQTTPATNWSDSDTLRCAVIERLINLGKEHNVLDSDAIKYFPIIFPKEHADIYINFLFALNYMAKKDGVILRSDYIFENDVRNDDLFGVSGYKDISLIEKIKSLKSEIINEIDFKKYYGNTDGDMAVCVLYSYLASLNTYLHILKVPDKGVLDRIKVAKDNTDTKVKVFCCEPGDILKNGMSYFLKDGMSYLAKKAETRKHIFIFLEKGHYQAILLRPKLKKQLAKGKIKEIEIDKESEKIIDNDGKGACLFYSVAYVLKHNKIDKTVDGDLLNYRTKEYLNANFERFFSGLYDQMKMESYQIKIDDKPTSDHFMKLFTLMTQYDAAVK